MRERHISAWRVERDTPAALRAAEELPTDNRATGCSHGSEHLERVVQEKAES